MMRDLLISELQDGHALIRLMFMTALVAASWCALRPEMKSPWPQVPGSVSARNKTSFLSLDNPQARGTGGGPRKEKDRRRLSAP
jgi:hypothetical protein